MLELPGAYSIKQDPRRSVVVVPLNGELMVFKLYEETAFRHRIGHLVRRCAARRAFDGARRLQAAGFDAPEVVAVGERGRHWARTGSCLVTHWIPKLQLDVAWTRWCPSKRPCLAADVGDHVGRLHRAGVYPQDMKASNFLVAAAEQPVRPVMVDTDRVRQYSKLSRRRRMKNLAQLERSFASFASSESWHLFLEAYVQSRQAPSELAQLQAAFPCRVGPKFARPHEDKVDSPCSWPQASPES